MLDKTIHKHLDQMDAFQEEADAGIEKVMKNIDIDDLMDDPDAYLKNVIESVKSDVVDKMAERVVMAGRSFVNAVDKKDEIVVDDSQDPQKNKELVDGQGRD
jgi:hypothetical protein